MFSEEEIASVVGLPFWPHLNDPIGAELIREVRDEWEALLNNREAVEGEYHKFLAENAGFFFGPSMSTPILLSKVQLGRDHETDFVLNIDHKSYGFCYNLIEIESPHVAPYTKSGNPHSRLTHALQQVQDWRHWLEANRSEAKRLFPSKEFLVHDRPSFQFTIFMGRRESSRAWLYKRNELSQQSGVEIRSFDALTEIFSKKMFPPIAMDLMNQFVRLPIMVLHEMANPFLVAFTDREWSEIRLDSRFESFVHMIEANADLFLQHRRLNHRYTKFLKSLEAVPLEDVKTLYRYLFPRAANSGIKRTAAPPLIP